MSSRFEVCVSQTARGHMSKLNITATVVVLFALLVVSAVIGGLSLFVSTRRQLSSLESILLTLFLWAAAIAFGVICSSVYARKSAISSLEERARPAIRRVSELLRASQHLQARIRRHTGSPSATLGAGIDDSLSLFFEDHVGQLRAAVTDWKELLPENYVDDVLASQWTPDPGSLSWQEFQAIYLDLASKFKKGTLWGGYHPTFMIGVYPAGGMIGYLFWLELGRRCPIFMAPDPDAPPSSLDALGSRVKDLCHGQGKYDCLIVDASLKTGKSMAATKDMIEKIGLEKEIDLEIKTLCLIQYPLAEKPVIEADFVGVKKAVHLPFGDA